MSIKEDDSSSFKQMVLFTYSLRNLKTQSQKIQFYYALKGRDGKSGVIREYKIEQLAKTVLLVDSIYDKSVQEFFNLWKIRFERREVKIKDA